MNIRIFSGFSLAYIGLGFLVHIIFLGTVLNWSSALTYFVLLLWPLYLGWMFIILLFWLALAAAVVFGLYAAYCHFTGRSI